MSSSKRALEDRDQLIASRLGYTNTSNPFNDSNLSQRLEWSKKVNGVAGQVSDKLDELQRVKDRRELAQKEKDAYLLGKAEKERMLASEG